jgi:hypothetical protein
MKLLFRGLYGDHRSHAQGYVMYWDELVHQRKGREKAGCPYNRDNLSLVVGQHYFVGKSVALRKLNPCHDGEFS